jgi:hypothetical protein
MSELDLTEAERAVRLELARVIEGGIAVDLGAYAVRAALPHILEALAEWAEDDPESEWAGEPVSPDYWLRAKAREARDTPF